VAQHGDGGNRHSFSFLFMNYSHYSSKTQTAWKTDTKDRDAQQMPIKTKSGISSMPSHHQKASLLAFLSRNS
jgi:hypothetical protein